MVIACTLQNMCVDILDVWQYFSMSHMGGEENAAKGRWMFSLLDMYFNNMCCVRGVCKYMVLGAC